MMSLIQIMIFLFTFSLLLFVIGTILSRDFREAMLRQAGRLGRIFLIIFIILIAVVLYIASPVDLVPDWIPVLGQCDDIIIALLSVGFIALTLLYNLGVIGFDVTSILGSRRNSIRGLPNRQDRNK